MAKKASKRVTAQESDLELLGSALKSQGNAIPPAVAVVVRLIAPVLARIAIRYVARRLHRSISEDTVRAGGAYVGSIIQGVLERASASD